MINKKRVLILGGSGVLGRHLVYHFLNDGRYKISATYNSVRKLPAFFSDIKLIKFNYFKDDKLFLSKNKFDYVINCIAITPQRRKNSSLEEMYYVNSLLPSEILNNLSNESLFINISTDSVFSGKPSVINECGSYSESAECKPLDDYGISKALGEVHTNNSLNIRTAFIGYGNKKYLLDWFLSQKKGSKINGYVNYKCSLISAAELSKAVSFLAENYVIGTVNVGSEVISKYDALCVIRKVFNKLIDIVPTDEPKINRSLDCTKLKNLGFIPKDFETQIIELKELYAKFRTNRQYTKV